MLLAVVVCKRVCVLAQLNTGYSLVLEGIIPTVVTMITCMECSGLQELAMISGAATGVLLAQAKRIGILSALFNGLLCAELLSFLLVKCAQFSFLPTATTIIATGISSIISATFSLYLFDILQYNIQGVAVNATEIFLQGSSDMRLRIIFGALCGILTSWGSENGYYHTVMLPLIALEMGFGEMSFVGAFE